MLRERVSAKWLKRMWMLEKILLVIFIILILIVIGITALLVVAWNPQYYFAWYFATTSIATYIVTDYVVLRFERRGEKTKKYQLVRFVWFFIGIIASSEVAAFLSLGYDKTLNTAFIGWIIIVLTIISVVTPWFYFNWRSKSSEGS